MVISLYERFLKNSATTRKFEKGKSIDIFCDMECIMIFDDISYSFLPVGPISAVVTTKTAAFLTNCSGWQQDVSKEECPDD